VIVNVRIERLTIEGGPLGAADVAIVRRALRAELTRRFTSGPLPSALTSSGIAVPALAAAPMRMPPTPTPAQWGQGIAQSVHGVMGT
jgi:hypothetical protein